MKRNLIAAVLCLFAVWLVSVAVLLCFLAQIVGVPWLVGAIVAQIGVAAVSAGILLVTNTRRPWYPSPDSFGLTTDDLLRPPLRAHEDRRVRNGTVEDRGVVQRLSDILEAEAARRQPGETPAWVLSMGHDRPDDAFPDTPKEE